MVIDPSGAVLNGSAPLLALVIHLSLEVQIFSLDQLPAVFLGVVTRHSRLALGTAWVAHAASRIVLVGELVCRRCENIEGNLIRRLLAIRILNLNLRHISRSFPRPRPAMHKTHVQEIVELAFLQSSSGSRPLLLENLS